MEEVDHDNIVEESENIEEDIRTASSVPMNPSDIIVLKFADNNRPGVIFYSLGNYELLKFKISVEALEVIEIFFVFKNRLRRPRLY